MRIEKTQKKNFSKLGMIFIGLYIASFVILYFGGLGCDVVLPNCFTDGEGFFWLLMIWISPYWTYFITSDFTNNSSLQIILGDIAQSFGGFIGGYIVSLILNFFILYWLGKGIENLIKSNK